MIGEQKNTTIVYATGWDSFSRDAGSDEEVFCRVCSSLCDVRRACTGPRSWIESMGRSREESKNINKDNPFDRYTCPNTGYPWHNQALALLMRSEKTPSKREEDSLKQEAQEIIKNKQSTKEVGAYT